MSSLELAVRVMEIAPATPIAAALGMELGLALRLCGAAHRLAQRRHLAAAAAAGQKETPGRRVVDHPGGRRTVHLSGPDALDALRGYMAAPAVGPKPG